MKTSEGAELAKQSVRSSRDSHSSAISSDVNGKVMMKTNKTFHSRYSKMLKKFEVTIASEGHRCLCRNIAQGAVRWQHCGLFFFLFDIPKKSNSSHYTLAASSNNWCINWPVCLKAITLFMIYLKIFLMLRLL